MTLLHYELDTVSETYIVTNRGTMWGFNFFRKREKEANFLQSTMLEIGPAFHQAEPFL